MKVSSPRAEFSGYAESYPRIISIDAHILPNTEALSQIDLIGL